MCEIVHAPAPTHGQGRACVRLHVPAPAYGSTSRAYGVPSAYQVHTHAK